MCQALVHNIEMIRSISVIVDLEFLLCGTRRYKYIFSHPLLVILLPLLVECNFKPIPSH